MSGQQPSRPFVARPSTGCCPARDSAWSPQPAARPLRPLPRSPVLSPSFYPTFVPFSRLLSTIVSSLSHDSPFALGLQARERRTEQDRAESPFAHVQLSIPAPVPAGRVRRVTQETAPFAHSDAFALCTGGGWAGGGFGGGAVDRVEQSEYVDTSGQV